jgi:hypothetical protein
LRARTIRPALALALALFVASAAAAQAGGRQEERSSVERLRPPVDGVELEVAGGDRFLVLRNESGETVIVSGYAGEPYLRFRPGGLVEENVRSPSKYVNDDRYGLTPVPQSATPEATPRWRRVAENGTYRWFDHRIHSMDKGIPKQVKDPSQRTEIFDWNVPMDMGGRRVVALGSLQWVPVAAAGDDGVSAGLVAAIAAAVAAVVAALVLVLRRRRRAAPAGAPDTPDEPRREKEAW